MKTSTKNKNWLPDFFTIATWTLWATAALWVLIASAPLMHAADRQPASSDPSSLVNNRSKSLDFDSDVIEGMNKNPLDSLTRLGRKDDKQQGHLYRRKNHFRREIRQTVQEMGYTQ